MNTVQQQFNALELIRIFEVSVIDKRTGETDYIIFDISINDDKLQAQHVALNEEEQASNKIAFKSVDIDGDYCLDSHLESLHEECINAVISSDFYELNEE